MMNKKGYTQLIVILVVLFLIYSFLQTGSFIPNQNFGYNIDIDYYDNVVQKGQYLSFDYDVILSAGAWDKVWALTAVYVFVDGQLLDYKIDERIARNYRDNKEFLIFDNSQSLPTDRVGKHKVNVVVIAAEPDDADIGTSDFAGQFHAQVLPYGSYNDLKTSVNGFIHVYKERSFYYYVNQDIINIPDMDAPAEYSNFNLWEQIQIFVNNIFGGVFS